jgi:hypothetical protein
MLHRRAVQTGGRVAPGRSARENAAKSGAASLARASLYASRSDARASTTEDVLKIKSHIKAGPNCTGSDCTGHA